eukprot:2641842-Alexandrium_andersonii.AAC.1
MGASEHGPRRRYSPSVSIVETTRSRYVVHAHLVGVDGVQSRAARSAGSSTSFKAAGDGSPLANSTNS